MTLTPPRAAAALVGLMLVLTGCAAGTPADPGAKNDTDTSVRAAEHCADADAPLNSLPLIESPRTATEGVTACLASDAVETIDDTTAPALPTTITDAEGREVTISDVSRILPLDVSGTIAATVFGLGLGDNVVGRDTSTGFAGTEHLPQVTGAGHVLAVEAILELGPTVVLTDTTIGPKEVRQQLRDAGIPVVMITADRRLDTTDAFVAEVAASLGVVPRGAALAARLGTEIDAARAEVAAIAPAEASDRVRVAFLYARGTANIYYIFGADSGTDSLIDALSAVDVAAEIGWTGMKPMNAEALIAAQPDVLFMMSDGLESVGGIDGLLERIPALAQTPAGQQRRVIDMPDDEVLSFGPRSAQIIRALAKAMYTVPAETAVDTATDDTATE